MSAEDEAAFAAAIARFVEEIAAGTTTRSSLIPPRYRADASACMARELSGLTTDEKVAVINYRDADKLMQMLRETTEGTPAFHAVEACFQAAADAAGIN